MTRLTGTRIRRPLDAIVPNRNLRPPTEGEREGRQKSKGGRDGDGDGEQSEAVACGLWLSLAENVENIAAARCIKTGTREHELPAFKHGSRESE